MKRFAQLVPVEGREDVKRVHNVFEAEEKPEFASYIEIVEVDESVKENMFYLVEEGGFIEEFELFKPPTLEERINALEVALLELILEGDKN